MPNAKKVGGYSKKDLRDVSDSPELTKADFMGDRRKKSRHKPRCDRCGKRPARFFMPRQDDAPGFAKSY